MHGFARSRAFFINVGQPLVDRLWECVGTRKECCNVGLIKAARLAAEVAGHFNRTEFIDDGVRFFLTQGANHLLHTFVRAAAFKAGFRFKRHVGRLFPEETTIDFVRIKR